MLVLDEFALTGWSTWGKGKLDLSIPGITFVRGKNLDRVGSNGSGKSSFFNGMYAMITGDHQLAVRKRSLGSITSDRTLMRLKGRREGVPFVSTMKNTTLSLVIDGKAVENRTKDSARATLNNEIVRMSPELWSSMVHINGIASNPLIRGTSSQRCQFLENAFDLNRWAEKYSQVGDVVSGMKRARADLDDARTELKNLPEPINVPALQKQVELLQKQRDSYQDSVKTLRETLARYRALPPKPKRDATFYERTARQIESQLRDIRDSAEERERWSELKARHDEVTRQRRDLKRIIADVKHVASAKADLDVEAMQTRLDALLRQKKKYQDYVDHSVPIIRWRDEASAIAKQHGIRYRSDEELRSMSRAWVSAMREGSTRCPVCGSAFKSRVERKRLDVLANLLDDLPDDLTVVDVKSVDETLIRKLEAKINRARDYWDAHGRLSKLKDVKLPPEPKRPAGSELTLAKKLSAANELLVRARAWENVDDADVDSVEDRLRVREEKLSKIETDIDDLHSKISQAESAASVRESVEKRIAKLDEEVRLHPVYKSLHQAYSTGGMRLWMLSEMLEAIVSSLNATVGSHQVSYGYKLSKNRDLTLTVSNLSGTFDVRMLSGGESGQFCIVLVTALLPLLPDHKRCSVLVLDEVDANIDQPNRRIVENEYLPKLAEIVPSMFVVTPFERELFCVEGANEILVVKKDSVSRFT